MNTLEKRIHSQLNTLFKTSDQNTINGYSKIQLNELVVLAKQQTPSDILHSSDPSPSKTESNLNETILFGEEATTDKMFGLKGGYIHPFLSVKGEWTDNLYNLNIDETESLITTGSTGIWYSLPRLEEVPLNFSTNNSAIGGKRFSFFTDKDSFERSILYLLAGVEYRNYSENSDLNDSAWKVEGQYQQNLPAGISVSFIDRFSRGKDRYDIGSFLPQDFIIEDGKVFVADTPSRTRTYYSNLANLSVLIDMTGKFSSQLQYSNFILEYENEENNWLNRSDNSFLASMSYKYSPKTSFFFGYDYSLINYDTERTFDRDSTSYVAGIQWKGSDKTSLYFKGGYQEKTYDLDISESPSTFTTELHFNYAITDKTKIALNLYKALEESNSQIYDSMDTTAAHFNYQQRFNYRFSGHVNFTYEKNDYEGFTSIGINDSIGDREDIRFSVRPAIEYTFRDWMMFDLAYVFENRDSNINIYDFTTQTVSLSMNIAF